MILNHQVFRYNVQHFRQGSSHAALLGLGAIDSSPFSVLITFFLAKVDDRITAILVDHRAALETLVTMSAA